ncbi:MAG TPA: hypothetical protein VHR66_24460 [Gemmataceae bacterium]|nr:hypothetical protein [Gemmataceae bacterium]
MFLDGSIGAVFPSLHGRRWPTPGYVPNIPWRYPALDGGRLKQYDISTDDGVTNGVIGGNFLIGYRLDGGWGEVAVNVHGVSGDAQTLRSNGDPLADAYAAALYKFGGSVGGMAIAANKSLNTESGVFDPLGAALSGTSLSAYAVDFTYGSAYTGLPFVDLRWAMGARFGVLDSYDAIKSRDIESRTDTHFNGVGPMIAITADWILARSGNAGTLSLLTRVDSSLLYGRTRQIDRETTGGLLPWGYQYVSLEANRIVPTTAFDVALVGRFYDPRVAVLAGYRYENWKGVGGVGVSDWDLMTHTVYVGLQFNY